MEKVKLTQEQVDAIEDLLKQYGDRKVLIHEYLYLTGEINENIEIIKKMDYDQLFSYLYQGIGYEVEPEFKVGDWITATSGYWKGKTLMIIKCWETDENRYDVDVDVEQKGSVYIEDIRHATPEEIAEEKERRWWAKHNRDVWELRKGDLLKSKDEGYISEIEKTHQNGDTLFKGGVTSMNLSTAKEIYEMCCFVEDRKDV